MCACLTNGSLGDNVPLLYCLMHDQRILEPFHHDRELGHVAEYLWIIVTLFTSTRHVVSDRSTFAGA